MSEQVPEGWVKIKLGEAGDFSTSSVDKKSSEREKEVSLLNYMDVYNHSILTGEYRFQKVTAPSKQISSSSVQHGDVFFTPSSETPDDIGHSAVFIGGSKDTVHSYHTVRFRPYSHEYLDDDFKAYAFKGAATYEYFRKRASGSTRFTVSLPVFNELELIVPPLPEQKKIASILTSVDEVIEKTQSQIDKLQDLKKGTMNELLTKGIGHTEFKDSELGKIPKRWEVKSLSELSDRIGDGLHSTPIYTDKTDYFFINGNNFVDGGIRVSSTTKSVSENEFQNHYIELTDKTILMSINGTIGNLSIYNGEQVILGKSACYINLSTSVWRDFVYFHLSTKRTQDFFRDELTGTTIKNLSLKTIRSTPTPIPPFDEQVQISNIVSSISKNLQAKQTTITKLRSLKKSLMQDLLTGKVRVSVN
jgi:type I restriction enzyme, S subunit